LLEIIEHLLGPLLVERDVAKFLIKQHVCPPPRLRKYDLPLEHEKHSDQTELVLMHALKVVGIRAVCSILLHSNRQLSRRRRWL